MLGDGTITGPILSQLDRTDDPTERFVLLLELTSYPAAPDINPMTYHSELEQLLPHIISKNPHIHGSGASELSP
jgi:hypothetical protein